MKTIDVVTASALATLSGLAVSAMLLGGWFIAIPLLLLALAVAWGDAGEDEDDDTLELED